MKRFNLKIQVARRIQMKMKLKNNLIYVSLVILLLANIALTPISSGFASEGTKENGNSGGFIIETAKVAGTMDLLGALTGNITIWEGEISGLTITKILDRGDGSEPLVVRITAPGPIPVKNLNAQTINHELPNIGGLCKPEKIGRICLENVVMNVEEQVVENILLDNANIHTCKLSECGTVPEYQPLLSLEQLEGLLNGSDEEEWDEKLQEIIELIEEQEKYLERLKELLEGVSTSLSTLLDQDYARKLQELIAMVEDSLLSKLGLDQIIPDFQGLTATLEEFEDQLVASLDSLEESNQLIEVLAANIPSIENMLAEYEEENNEVMQLEEQYETYEQLVQLAEQQEAGETITYELTEEQEAEIEVQEGKETDELLAIKERLATLKEQFEEQKQSYDKLLNDVNEMDTEKQNVEEEVGSLRKALEELGLSKDEETKDGMVDEILDPVGEHVVDPVKDNVIKPVKDKVINPVQEKVLNPVLDPVKDNVLDPVQEGVVNPVLDGVNEVVKPINEKVLEPILDPVTGKLIDPLTGKVIDLVVDPVTNKLLDPLTEEVIVPVLNPLTGKLINPKTGESIKTILNPATDKLLDPLTNGLVSKLLDGIL